MGDRGLLPPTAVRTALLTANIGLTSGHVPQGPWKCHDGGMFFVRQMTFQFPNGFESYLPFQRIPRQIFSSRRSAKFLELEMYCKNAVEIDLTGWLFLWLPVQAWRAQCSTPSAPASSSPGIFIVAVEGMTTITRALVVLGFAPFASQVTAILLHGADCSALDHKD
ncbi:hypothetical protein S40293_10740 [Stachybotrys chartarum IBT 40293]|nr:hypothetical protein S40293_10740 [Stachybotrys chartarum IBT 40293]